MQVILVDTILLRRMVKQSLPLKDSRDDMRTCCER